MQVVNQSKWHPMLISQRICLICYTRVYMVNPFDRNFFKFLFGFLVILSVAFGIIYFVGRYSANAPAQATLAPK